ncbi:hypothetical protein Hanom_Chr16g01418421 [Helianthus anomalus]
MRNFVGETCYKSQIEGRHPFARAIAVTGWNPLQIPLLVTSISSLITHQISTIL